jgi:hypothetical protein
MSVQSCGFWQGKSDTAASPTPFVAGELKSAIPFSSKEPDVYQTEIVVTANGIEDVTLAARNRENRLMIFDYQTDLEISILHLGDGETFIIAPRRKIYAQKEFAAKSANANDFFTAEWLNQKADAKFETLGRENDFMIYRVILDDAVSSEIIIFVDEKIGLPIKQEFYNIRDGQKVLISKVELRNFTLQADAKLFEVPKDFQKVATKEFYETTARTSQIKK